MEQLLVALQRGDYPKALELFGKPDAQALERLLREAKQRKTAYPHSAAVAELKFYMGENTFGQNLLEIHKKNWESNGRLPDDSARWSLQLTESIYSRGSETDYRSAAKLATAVLERAQNLQDWLGVGEAAYYLMRINRRLHEYEKVDRHRHQAIEAFGEARAQKRIDVKVLTWRLGLVYLVAGFTDWRVGRMESAMGLLHTAGLLLEGANDFIAKANTKHTIGVILRSRGQFELSLEQLRESRDLYKDNGHTLNHARVLTDIARVYLHQELWQDAHEALNEAEQLATHAPRHNAEVALWKSWLAQSPESTHYNLATAHGCAITASEAESLTVRVEGHIAYGYALAELRSRNAEGQWDDPEREFNKAIEVARDRRMGKHFANALLSLAYYYCQYVPAKLSDAVRCFNEAEEILSATGNSGSFLKEKAIRVRDLIAANQNPLIWVSVAEDVLKDGLDPTTGRFELWAIDRAIQLSGSLANAASKFDMNEEALSKRRQRLRRRFKKRPSSPAGKTSKR